MIYPKISIVTPNYNYGHFLESTIQSVISQNYPNLEYIIIDGGSTDNSIDIIKKYEQHISYWISEPDKGMYDAINKGFNKSTGSVMAWLNSDDIYLPWALKVVGEVFLQFGEVNWLTTLQPGAIDYNGYVLEFGKFSGFSRDAFMEGRFGVNHSYGYIQQESTFWRRPLWEKAGSFLSTGYSLAGDFELWQRFYKHDTLFGISSPLSLFRFQPQQKTRQYQEYARQCSEILKLNEVRHGPGSYLRKIISGARMDKIPKLNKLVTSACGYKGHSIGRADKNAADSAWKMRSYKFL